LTKTNWIQVLVTALVSGIFSGIIPVLPQMPLPGWALAGLSGALVGAANHLREAPITREVVK
jgi:hypothetical protein